MSCDATSRFSIWYETAAERYVVVDSPTQRWPKGGFSSPFPFVKNSNELVGVNRKKGGLGLFRWQVQGSPVGFQVWPRVCDPGF